MGKRRIQQPGEENHTTATGKSMPADYLADQDAEDLVSDAEKQSLRRLMWQMDNGPTLIAKERAAMMVAKLCVRRPPQRIDQTIQMDARVTQMESEADTARRRRAERLALETNALEGARSSHGHDRGDSDDDGTLAPDRA